MWNPGAFTKEQREEVEKMPNRIVVDPGDYDPVLGHSYAEIAGMSRSMHRSQGMGAAERKGSAKDFLVTQAGPVATHDIFDGIDISWNRVPGGAPVGKIAGRGCPDFRSGKSRSHRAAAAESAKSHGVPAPTAAGWQAKRAERSYRALFRTCGWTRRPDKYAVTPGGALKFEATALNRDHLAVQVKSIDIEGIVARHHQGQIRRSASVQRAARFSL